MTEKDENQSLYTKLPDIAEWCMFCEQITPHINRMCVWTKRGKFVITECTCCHKKTSSLNGKDN